MSEHTPQSPGFPWHRLLVPAGLVVLAPIGAPVGVGWGWSARRRGASRAGFGVLAVAAAVVWVGCVVLGGGVGAFVSAYVTLGSILGLTQAPAAVGSLTWLGLVASNIAVAAAVGAWMSRTLPEGVERQKSRLGRLWARRNQKKIRKNNTAVIEGIAAGHYATGEDIALGVKCQDGVDVTSPGDDDIVESVEVVTRPDLEDRTSTFSSCILGGSGSGKTTLLKRLFFDYVTVKQDPVLVIDLKGDGELARFAAACAEQTGAEFWHFTIPDADGYVGPSPYGGASYDPLRPIPGQTATERRDFALAIMDDAEGNAKVYDEALKPYVGRIMEVDTAVWWANEGRALDGVKGVPVATLPRLAALAHMPTLRSYLDEAVSRLGAERLERFLPRTVEEIRTAVNELSQSKDKIAENSLKTFKYPLVSLHESALGRYLQDSGDDNTVSLQTLIDSGGVAVFDLNADGSPDEVTALVKVLLSDLTGSMKRSGGTDGSLRLRIVIDEFSAVPDPRVVSLFQRGRSYGFSTVLSTQTVEDLTQVSEEFAGRVFKNVGETLLFGASDADDAERFSRLTGTMTGEELEDIVDATTGEVTSQRRRIKDVPLVSVAQFLSMRRGEVARVVTRPHPGQAKAELVKIVPPPALAAPLFRVLDEEEVNVEPVEPAMSPEPIGEQTDTDAEMPETHIEPTPVEDLFSTEAPIEMDVVADGGGEQSPVLGEPATATTSAPISADELFSVPAEQEAPRGGDEEPTTPAVEELFTVAEVVGETPVEETLSPAPSEPTVAPTAGHVEEDTVGEFETLDTPIVLETVTLPAGTTSTRRRIRRRQ